jgi:hypothetical protein
VGSGVHVVIGIAECFRFGRRRGLRVWRRRFGSIGAGVGGEGTHTALHCLSVARRHRITTNGGPRPRGVYHRRQSQGMSVLLRGDAIGEEGRLRRSIGRGDLPRSDGGHGAVVAAGELNSAGDRGRRFSRGVPCGMDRGRKAQSGLSDARIWGWLRCRTPTSQNQISQHLVRCAAGRWIENESSSRSNRISP